MADRQPLAPRPARVLLALLLSGLVAGSLAACDDSSADDASGAGGASASSPSGSSSSSPSAPASSSPAAPSFGRYVAIGDSYTAAPGVPGEQSQDGCLRSSANYPHVLAETLDIGRLVDVSCSGADTSDVGQRQLRGVAPQLRAVTKDTDLVTIGLGGNDLDLFMRLITTCFRQDAATAPGTPCTDTLGSAAPAALDTIERNLVGVVEDVRAKAPSATVVLVGYPQILPASGTCAAVPFARGDYGFARKVNHGLAEAVHRAATATRATYVDLWRAGAGHDICSADPWINGISGPGAAPFHPFASEQTAVAGLVAAALR